jgi:hypothetical protein
MDIHTHNDMTKGVICVAIYLYVMFSIRLIGQFCAGSFERIYT